MKAHIGEMFNMFDARRDDASATKMTAYLLNQFPHFGIKTKPRRLLAHEHNKGFDLNQAEFLAFAKVCYAYPEREMHHYCLDTLQSFKKKFTQETITLSEYLIMHNSWWDTVDTVNSKISAVIFARDRKLQQETVLRWKDADNMWLRRSAIIAQIKFRSDTDTDLLSQAIESNLGSDEFFINKAIGWALREYGDVNPEWVLRYVKKIELHPLSHREAIRKII